MFYMVSADNQNLRRRGKGDVAHRLLNVSIAESSRPGRRKPIRGDTLPISPALASSLPG